MKVDKARLEATLDVLHQERETATALTEADVLETAAELGDREPGSGINIQVASHDSAQRTSDYLHDH